MPPGQGGRHFTRLSLIVSEACHDHMGRTHAMTFITASQYSGGTVTPAAEWPRPPDGLMASDRHRTSPLSQPREDLAHANSCSRL